MPPSRCCVRCPRPLDVAPANNLRPQEARRILVRLDLDGCFFTKLERALLSLLSCYGRLTRARLH
jgi:succinyl-CoA synthetase beta subunit